MTQNSHLLLSDFGLNSFQELIYQPPKKAGDHLDDLDAFREALLEDLSPMRPHEAVIAENIVMIEWDIAQIMIQKRHIARSAVFDEITEQYLAVAREAHDEAERLRRLEEMGGNDDVFSRLSTFDNLKVFDPHEAKMNARMVLLDLQSGEADRINRAQEQIQGYRPYPETILAVVYDLGSKYRRLDDALSGLEQRRRRILEDYKNLQNARAIDLDATG